MDARTRIRRHRRGADCDAAGAGRATSRRSDVRCGDTSSRRKSRRRSPRESPASRADSRAAGCESRPTRPAGQRQPTLMNPLTMKKPMPIRRQNRRGCVSRGNNVSTSNARRNAVARMGPTASSMLMVPSPGNVSHPDPRRRRFISGRHNSLQESENRRRRFAGPGLQEEVGRVDVGDPAVSRGRKEFLAVARRDDPVRDPRRYRAGRFMARSATRTSTSAIARSRAVSVREETALSARACAARNAGVAKRPNKE